jgi:hypothetical protein
MSRTLISNGTVVTASDTFAADVWIEGERIVALTDPSQRAALGQADRTIDAAGQYVLPGGDRRPHAPRSAVRRHHLVRRLRHRHDRRGPRRHDDDHRLRDPAEGRLAAGRPRHLARQGRGQGRDRLRLPHDHDRGPTPRPSRAWRRWSRRGRDQLQDVHGLPGRAPGRRPADLPGDAARRRAGRADHDARRDRPADRRAGRARAGRGPHRADLPRADPPRGRRGHRHRARDRAGRDGRRCRCTSCTSRRSARSSG